MPNGINLGSTVFTQWSAQQGGGYFLVTDNVVLSSIFLFARWRYLVVVATIN
mgnify:CR=1 FL=1